MGTFTAAFLLVIISIASAEIPRQKIEIIRRSAPYVARGWVPQGQQLNLPLRQVPTPAPSYGPPEAAEPTTTELPTTTEATTERLLSQQKEKSVEKPQEKENLENLEEPQQGQYFVVLPQEQNLVYTVPTSAGLLAVQKQNFFAAPARLQAVPVRPSVASSVFTPFSASYIQIYQ